MTTSFNSRASWAKAGKAASVAAKMNIRRVQSMLQHVDAELEHAQAELKRRSFALKALSALPEGWEAVTDEASGEAYYYNAQTGETTWERPAGATPESALPDGWVAVPDPEGNLYYYHPATGVSSWDPPGATTAVPDGTSAAVWAAAEAAEKLEEESSEVPARAPSVPLWRAIGVPEARASERQAELSKIEAAVAAGDFETAIELRDQLRLDSGRSNSIHMLSAEL